MNAIDLFCGAGGFTLAAQKCNVSVLGAIENYAHACTTYHHNFIKDKENPPYLFQEDIRNIDPTEFATTLNLNPGELDLILGGPPCQGFSTHRFKDAGVNDPRNELLLRYFQFVDYLKPKAFLVENVPGMLWKRHEEYVAQFYSLAQESGYHIFDPEILNAKDYGVPQNRRRVFILGLLEKPTFNGTWAPPQTHFNPNSNEVVKEGKPSWVPASIVFQQPLRKDDPNNIHMKHCKELIDVFKSTPINGGSREQSNRTLPCHKNGYHGHKDVYGRINPDQVGPTITAGCINPSKGRFVHPTKHHGITSRHAARFQTFPDSFVFQGGITASGTQIGNAVPILLGKQVITRIVEILNATPS